MKLLNGNASHNVYPVTSGLGTKRKLQCSADQKLCWMWKKHANEQCLSTLFFQRYKWSYLIMGPQNLPQELIVEAQGSDYQGFISWTETVACHDCCAKVLWSRSLSLIPTRKSTAPFHAMWGKLPSSQHSEWKSDMMLKIPERSEEYLNNAQWEQRCDRLEGSTA